MYPVHPQQTLGDDHFDHLVEHGFVILPAFIQGEELATLQAAQRRVLKSWEQVKENPPSGLAEAVTFPYGDTVMAGLFPHPELLKLGRRYLKTEKVFFIGGTMLTRYPGCNPVDPGHIDNGNNSLLPMTRTAREYSQLTFWIHLEEVGVDQAPLMLVSHKDNRDNSKAIPLACPAGSVLVFTNYTWHFASKYLRTDGQRFSWAFMLGRADHPFEGLTSYTSLGQNPIFSRMIGGLSAEDRQLFRFPPPNDAYYTKETLAALEQQYPGWNARGEYSPVD